MGTRTCFLPTSCLSLALLAILSAGSSAAAQAPPWGQALSFGGNGDDTASVIKVDRKSNKYVAGYFSGRVRFGNRILTSAGNADGFVMKFRSDGSFGWVAQIGGSDYDQAFDIGFDGDENVYVSGSITGNVTFGSVDHVDTIVHTNGNSMFLAKYDASGDLLWVETGQGDSGGDNEGFGVAVNPASGVVYMTGRAQGSTRFSSVNGRTCTLANGDGEWHAYLVKYDSHGNCQWLEQSAASGNSIAHKVAIDSNNNAYLVGWFEGGLTFTSRNGHSLSVQGYSPGPGGYPYPDDGFVAKFNSHGDAEWINHVGGWKAIANDVAVNPLTGEVTLTGFMSNINSGDSRAVTLVSSQPPGTTVNLGGGDYTTDGFLVTYDRDGVVESASRIGGPQTDAGTGVAYDAQGNLYVSGEFAGAVDFGGITLDGPAANNLFVLKFTGSTLDWAKMAPGGSDSNLENDARVAVNSATGKVFVAGPFEGSAIFGNTKLVSAGQQDIFYANIPASPPD
ncbi:MAG TPA: SBBP repeat-containing protein [Verrucomicrobiae bacterium]|nr:SBBP repeat-containing protein [Verrucomicrobiae bacterium]